MLRDMPLKHVWIVYPEPDSYRLNDAVSVLPVTGLADGVNGLGA